MGVLVVTGSPQIVSKKTEELKAVNIHV